MTIRNQIYLCFLLALLCACFTPKKDYQRKQDKADATEKAIRDKEGAIQDAGRAYNFATGYALNKATNTEPAIEVAKDMNSKSQVIYGPPSVEDAQTMTQVVNGKLSSDEGEQKKADKLESKFIDAVAALQAEKAELKVQHDKELTELRKQNEANAEDAQKWRDYQRKHWLKRIFATLGIFGTIAGLVALCIFFPPALRIIGWLVGKIPSVATGLGVVATKTFDAVVVGVGNARNHFKLNKDQQYTGAQVKDILDAKLKEATDADHRNVIEARREKLGVDYVHVNEVPK